MKVRLDITNKRNPVSSPDNAWISACLHSSAQAARSPLAKRSSVYKRAVLHSAGRSRVAAEILFRNKRNDSLAERSSAEPSVRACGAAAAGRGCAATSATPQSWLRTLNSQAATRTCVDLIQRFDIERECIPLFV
jgi:hypothetical protein